HAAYRFFGPTRRFRKSQKNDPDLFIEMEAVPKPKELAAESPHRFSIRIPLLTGVLAISLALFVVANRSTTVDKSDRIPTERLSLEKVTTSGTVTDAAVSPDGHLIVYVDDGHLLRLKQLGAESEVELYAASEGRITWITFAPDQSAVYFELLPSTVDATELWRVPL